MLLPNKSRDTSSERIRLALLAGVERWASAERSGRSGERRSPAFLLFWFGISFAISNYSAKPWTSINPSILLRNTEAWLKQSSWAVVLSPSPCVRRVRRLFRGISRMCRNNPSTESRLDQERRMGACPDDCEVTAPYVDGNPATEMTDTFFSRPLKFRPYPHNH